MNPSSLSGRRLGFMMLAAAGGVLLGAVAASLAPKIVFAVLGLINGGS